jgi:hypothetical protein
VDLPPPPPTRSRRKWGVLIIVLVLLFVGTGYVGVFVVKSFVSNPAFDSVDQLDASQITAMKVFVLNRPDGGPDLGYPKGMTIASPDYEKVLAPLRNARPVHTDRGVWLGRLTVTLADGRSQSILLYRAQPDPKVPPVLRFKIGSFQYEAGPVDGFVSVLVECEPRSAAAGPG